MSNIQNDTLPDEVIEQVDESVQQDIEQLVEESKQDIEDFKQTYGPLLDNPTNETLAAHIIELHEALQQNFRQEIVFSASVAAILNILIEKDIVERDKLDELIFENIKAIETQFEEIAKQQDELLSEDT